MAGFEGPRTAVLIFTLSIGAGVGLSSQGAQPKPRPACDAGHRLQDIKPCLQTFVDDESVTGMVALVDRTGEPTQLDAVGDFKTDSIFQIMSMSKPFIAVGTMMLVEQGKIPSVDSKVSALRGFEKFPYPDVTIRQLLTHTSGMWFKHEVSARTWHGIEPLLTNTLDKAPATTVRDKPLAFVAKHYANAQLYPLDKLPRQFRYSNIGYLMLGWIIESLSGRRLDDFMRRHVFEPMGMNDTFYFPDHASAAQRARIAPLDRRRIDPPDYNHYDTTRPGWTYASPAGGIYSTAADLRSFLTVFRTGGNTPRGRRLLRPVSIARLMTDQEQDVDFGCNGAMGRSLGFMVVRKGGCPGTPAYSEGTIFHRGRFSTEFWFDPVRDQIGISLYQRVEGEEYAFLPRRSLQQLIQRIGSQ